MTAAITPQQIKTQKDSASKRLWQASLNLEFSFANRRSFLSGNTHLGPLRVQRPFFPEGEDLCHIYILHPPGGMVAGDNLSFQFQAKESAQALLTTPSAGKFYRTDKHLNPQIQCTSITVDKNASIEWFPQETIVFDGCKGVLNNEYHLNPSSRFFTWEITCFGRRFGNAPFNGGEFRQGLTFTLDGDPLLIENSQFHGGQPMMSRQWGLQNRTVWGSFYAYVVSRSQTQEIKEQWQYTSQDNHQLAITNVDSLFIARYLGDSAEEAKNIFTNLWQALRPMVLNRTAEAPRIWKT